MLKRESLLPSWLRRHRASVTIALLAGLVGTPAIRPFLMGTFQADNIVATSTLSTNAGASESFGGDLTLTGNALEGASRVTFQDVQTPATPGSGFRLFSSATTGRSQPTILDATGNQVPLQRGFGFRQLAYWSGQPSATTLSSFGGGPNVAFGTGTARTQTSTNLLTSSFRTGIVSSAAASSLSSVTGSLKVWRGNATGLGGLFVVYRWAVSDAVLVGTANMFVGLISPASILNTDTSPSTKTNLIGVGCNSGDTHLQLYAAGSVAQSRVDLGASFPVNTTNVDIYELTLYAPPNGTTVTYRLRRLNTGDTTTGVIANAANLPDTNVFLGPQFFRSNGGTAAAVGIDVLTMYLESG